MRLLPSASAIAAAFALLALPAAVRAQATATPPAASRPAGCRGTTSQTSSFTATGTDGKEYTFPGYSEVQDVQPGSPAALAGFRFGDRVILQDGHDLIADPPPPAFAGDTVVFTVRRGGSLVPLTVVLGRWDPAEEAPGVTRVCRPLAAGSGGG
jgi:predicted metalloprotease with PDZ domain